MDSLTHNMKTIAGEYVLIAGSFAPAGTGAVTDVKGAGFTVARTGVGVYDVTLSEKYLALVAYTANVQRSADVDGDMKVVGADTVASTKIVTLKHLVAGTATEIAANAANRVHFTFVLRNTAITP